MMKTDNYAVFGQPISHSKSPRIHKLFAEQTGQLMDYVAQEVPAENFTAATTHFFAEGGKGLNCTVPLKELAWQYADQLTERARQAKAVNTLARQADGSILGDNTDGIGLLNDLTVNHGIELKGAKILILGAGGATRGIVPPLLEQQPSALVIANRNVGKAQTIAADFAALGEMQACDYASLIDRQFDLIINATSASLSGDLPPLPAALLNTGGSCYDLAYANQATAFVKWGLANNAAHSLDGLGMLVEQAAEAFYIWRGVRPQTTPVIGLLNDERELNSTNR
ncbi:MULTISPECIES: shikimate dehydrogenase [Methylomonas]|uniref:Shikimate dehydrogenase (NADP(+)) n=2 Tax=Methylomonas TaxID=416 RepID=A0A126T5G4_9GAMM|nr:MULTISPECIES: shikimate dehydrogenase [Methylomonas]AMK77312.1 shikimate dehydrogenase [Methylomonas denitrificans]OAH97812.1 shikimate dehydrogenase [Methylomonas methanica]TCV77536.1 shikimate dehydrogenase [Methylomonas methanica]